MSASATLEQRPLDRRTIRAEIALVVGLGLGTSALYAVLSIVDRLTRVQRLSQQTAGMNTAKTPDRPWLDLAYQLAGIGTALLPALLALALLARDAGAPPVLRRLGLDLRRPAGDLLRGTLMAAFVGVPGLGLYLAARELGLNARVAPANLTDVWWAVPVLVLAAVQNAVLEEVTLLGYLGERCRALGWSVPLTVGVSSLLRGSYHLYQGFGGFAGNVVMGVLFFAAYRRWGRVLPLVVAHALIDIVAFVGYTLLRGHVSWL